jgi:hypothetical protein
LAARERKNGVWIKLWATVFAVHQSPIAKSGLDGVHSSSVA